MTVLIDSWAWIEYIKGSQAGKKVQQYIESDEETIVSSINIAEVYHKLLNDMPKEANAIINDDVLPASFVVPLTTEIALQAAKNKHVKKLGMADAIVLATAQLHNCQILTGDPDFKNVENVVYLGR